MNIVLYIIQYAKNVIVTEPEMETIDYNEILAKLSFQKIGIRTIQIKH